MGSSSKRKQQQSAGSSSIPSVGATAMTPLEAASITTAHVQKKRKVVADGQSASMAVPTLEDKEEVSPSDNGNGGLFGLGSTLPHPAASNGSESAQEDGFEKIMTKDEKRKEKKRKREEKLALINVPKFMYDPRGFKNHKIGIAHIRELILHLVTENAAPTWMCIEHRSNIKHVVLLFVPGLQPSHLNLSDSNLLPSAYMPFSTRPEGGDANKDSLIPTIPRLFSHACPTRAPGDARRLHSVLQTLLNAPLSQSEKGRREKAKAEMMRKMKAGTSSTSSTTTQGDQAKYQFDPQVFLLTPNQMLDNEYPVPSYIPGSPNAPGSSSANGKSNGTVKEIGQVRAGNSNAGDEVWLPGQSGLIAKVVDTPVIGEVVKQGVSLSTEILGRLLGTSGEGSSETDATSAPPSSSTSTFTGEKAKLSSKKREMEGKAEIVVEVATKTPAFDMERFSVGKGWVETPTLKAGDGTAESSKFKVLAIDCEMCLTEDGPELTRATVIDFDSGKVVFDELCKPGKPVKDYLTQWSGITAEKLAKATLKLSDVQAYFLTHLLTPTTILLGHSLESDLNALKIRHPLCIDTALLYRHPRGQPYKPGLKWLVKQWLGREIQTAGAGGHDSEEDARACVDLLRMKLIQGPEFGEVGDETESIFERMSRHSENLSKPGKTSVICDYGKSHQWIKAKATTAVACKDDDQVLAGLMENVGKHDFAFARFMELANTLGWVTNQAGPLDTDIEKPELTIEDALANFNTRLSKLHASLPSNTALILVTGHGDPRPLAGLNERKSNFDRIYKRLGASGTSKLPQEEKWMSEDDRKLAAEAEIARAGMGFFCIKAGSS
ncbi:hypothetical protein QFC21_002786 [Naganishia friedmannii]|uniref:Uncharacterized protein n=1 Tax=Naganishia friedmannii TaxID=89922 RepID=A0ACC2VUT9_9TREE|nr:hypothetical protein QFC21_002786 [Naganishia friedmannii]